MRWSNIFEMQSSELKKLEDKLKKKKAEDDE